ncbi:alpha/beta hydrolase family esterase [Caenimonas terrae]|uniref:Alpha/beta hydrolase family esterase n=1 Tax=Caenimonas terrae TaxID=696074 RepID=A0ABW0NFF1_9BURK
MNNNDFQHFMNEAARLTRSGDLQAATSAIQSALGGAPAPGPGNAGKPGAIDVEARELPTGGRPQFVAGSFATTSGQREYKLFIPGGAGGKPLPLVVMLHGCTQTPDDFAAGTAMNDLAQPQGVYVLYPAQSQQANPQRCWNWFKHSHQQRGRGEPALLAGMTRQVMEQHAIDPDRVFVAGLSAGGAMAAILGDTYPDLYAAVGVHSGLAAGAASDLPSAMQAMQGKGAHPRSSERHVPTIVFHGDADATVHPRNGEQVAAASSAGAGAADVRQHQPAGRRRSTRSVHRDAGGQVLAEHWLVHGAAHAWSGGSARGSYTDASGPDASAEMLRFFLQHPRRPAR